MHGSVEAAQHKSLPPIGMIDVVDPQFWQATHQCRYRNLALDTGQLGANAVTDTPAERQRAHVASGDVQLIRAPLNRRIAIGRAEQAYN